nr:MAG TPA: hypothetical protein [Caudoviricetes sp.]
MEINTLSNIYKKYLKSKWEKAPLLRSEEALIIIMNNLRTKADNADAFSYLFYLFLCKFNLFHNL